MKTAALAMVAVLSFLLPGSPALATVSFERIVVDSVFAGTSYPRAVYVVDIGGDSALDVVVALDDFVGSSDRLVWYQNNGGGLFTEFVVDTLIDGPIGLDAGDIDGDMDVDIILATNDDLFLYTNNATTFTRTTIDGSISVGRVLEMVDVDQDADIDIAAQYNNGVFWYENDGTVSFTKRTVDSVPVVDIGLAVVPFDFDDDLDIVTSVYNADSSYGELVWYENDGSENFSRNMIDTHAIDYFGLAVSDLDGMGFLDIVVCAQDANDVIVYRYDEYLVLHKTTIDDSFDRSPRSVLFVDIDNDTDDDVIVTGGLSTGEVAYYENDGMATFTKRIIETFASSGRSISAGDIDGDTRPDIVAAMSAPAKLLWYDNSGTGTGVGREAGAPALRLAPNYPNPFNPSTTISFTLPAEAYAVIDIFGVRGEHVRQLMTRRLHSGPHRVSWDGRDDRGREMASGVYFCRLRAGGAESVRKMVLMK